MMTDLGSQERMGTKERRYPHSPGQLRPEAQSLAPDTGKK